MSAEIRWRDGTITTVDSLKSNYLYTIRQLNGAHPETINDNPEPIFQEVSHLLDHTHHEDSFDDFSNQSLLPNRFSQLGPGIMWMDADQDGDEDIFISGGRGLVILGDGRGNFTSLPGHLSGIKVYGEQRGAALADFNMDGRIDLLFTQNGAQTKLFQNINSKPGLRVRLRGTKNNPWAFGAKIQISYKDGSMGPVREIQSGSGYWSQNSPVQILGIKGDPAHLNIQWPDGSKTTESIQGKKLTITYNDN